MIFVKIAVFLCILELSGSSLAKRDVGECSEDQLQCPYDGKCLDVKDICTASTVCDKWDNFQFHKCITNEGFHSIIPTIYVYIPQHNVPINVPAPFCTVTTKFWYLFIVSGDQLVLCNSEFEEEKKAIPLEKLCDGRDDCKNMADETSMFCPGWLAY